MKRFIYKWLLRITDLFKEKPTKININSVKHLNELIANGFKLTSFEININNMPKDMDPLDESVRQHIMRMLESNACWYRELISLGESTEPEIFVCIVATEKYVKEAEKTFQEFSEKHFD
jgi:hypothetical protein